MQTRDLGVAFVARKRCLLARRMIFLKEFFNILNHKRVAKYSNSFCYA